MSDIVLTPEMTEEQYKSEIAAMMVRIEVFNEESTRRGEEIESLKNQSRALMSIIEAAVRRMESRVSS